MIKIVSRLSGLVKISRGWLMRSHRRVGCARISVMMQRSRCRRRGRIHLWRRWRRLTHRLVEHLTIRHVFVVKIVQVMPRSSGVRAIQGRVTRVSVSAGGGGGGGVRSIGVVDWCRPARAIDKRSRSIVVSVSRVCGRH